MDNLENHTTTQPQFSPLKLFVSSAGIAFILIGIGITIALAIAGYNLITEPEYLETVLSYAKQQESLFAKWVSAENLQSIELSSIFSLLIIVIAISMVLRVIIAFIAMCISSGKSLLNVSRNF